MHPSDEFVVIITLIDQVIATRIMFEAFYFKDNANDYRTTCLRRVQQAGGAAGKVVIVTGGTGALGQEMGFALYKGGATVILTGRKLEKVEKLIQKIEERQVDDPTFTVVAGGKLVPGALDLSDYDSIEAFVKEISSKYKGKVDCLVNNAGAVPSLSGYKESKYGLETSFQTNFVSTVLLTELMIPLLTKDTGRIVSVSTMSHKDAPKPIKWEVIPSNAETFGGYNKDYTETKWLLTAYTSHLSRRGVQAVSADPGVSPDSSLWDEQIAFVRFMARNVFYRLAKKSSQSAACATQCVLLDSVSSGGYYVSGVLDAPRDDTTKKEEWEKAGSLLLKSLPTEAFKKVCANVVET